MIATLTIIILGLAWLAWETDGLRVRLPAGPALAAAMGRDFEVNGTFEIEYARWDTFDWSPMTYKDCLSMDSRWKTPLCGWDWITERDHVVPEYQIEFNIYGCRYTWALNSTPEAAKVIGEAMKLNAKPHKPAPLPRLSYKGNKPKRRRVAAIKARG